MSLENFFEDLETQFDAKLGAQNNSARPASAVNDCNLVEINLENGSNLTLVAPVLGFDFIAGVSLVEPKWQFIKLSTVIKIFFEYAGSADLPKLRQIDQSIIDFLNRIPLPAQIFWQVNLGNEPRGGLLIDIHNQVLMLQLSMAVPLVGVPIDRILSIQIETVENFDELF